VQQVAFFLRVQYLRKSPQQREAGSTKSNASDTPVVHVTWSNPVYTAAEYTIQLEYKKASESTFTLPWKWTHATSHIISGI
jgi:hypothetical protein